MATASTTPMRCALVGFGRVLGGVIKAPSTLGTFLRDTVGRVRHAGATGPLTARADSGFYTHVIVAVCHKMDVRFSITVCQHPRLRNLIEAIPEEEWTPIPYWMEGAADVVETDYRPSRARPTPRRCGSSSAV